jgi:hypothetical protein
MSKNEMKIIVVPDHTFKIRHAPGHPSAGEPTGELGNTFAQLMGILLENSPQRTDTETFLAHSIREKLDDLKLALEPSLKPIIAGSNGETMPAMTQLELSEAEIEFLKSGMTEMRKRNAMTGSDWYWFVKPLGEAKAKAKDEEKETA